MLTKGSIEMARNDASVPYSRSWMDALIQGIGRVPGPPALFYLALFAAFGLLNQIVFWIDGRSGGSIDPARISDAAFMVFFVALYHHLSLVAGRSFEIFQPILKVTDAEAQTFKYRLTTLPNHLGWLAVIVGLILAVLGVQSNPESFGLQGANSRLPEFYQTGILAFVIASQVVLIFQTIRQLTLVHELHQQASGIDLFNLAPIQAFANLTSQGGIGIIVFVVFNIAIVETKIAVGAPLYILVLMGILAVFVFVIPLLGMRNRLKLEKSKLMTRSNEAIKSIIHRIHNQVSADEYEKMPGLNTTLSALNLEQNIIKNISTWPWGASTLKGFASSLFVPIFLAVVTRFLAKLI
jgi:hypothetical protein